MLFARCCGQVRTYTREQKRVTYCSVQPATQLNIYFISGVLCAIFSVSLLVQCWVMFIVHLMAEQAETGSIFPLGMLTHSGSRGCIILGCIDVWFASNNCNTRPCLRQSLFSKKSWAKLSCSIAFSCRSKQMIPCFVLCIVHCRNCHSCCPKRWRAEYALCGWARAAAASVLMLCTQSSLLFAIQLSRSVALPTKLPR